MTFEVVSTRSWNVLATFEDESVAREAVHASVAERGADVHDLLVCVSDDEGHPVGELSDEPLAEWAGLKQPISGGAVH